MGTIVLYTHISLDGFNNGPNGELDWPLVFGEFHRSMNDELRDADTFLYGRGVWDINSAFWPTAAETVAGSPAHVDFAGIWNPKPKIVFSGTLEHAGLGARIVRPDGLTDEIARLRAQPGTRHVLFGGARIAETFVANGFLDELRVNVHPVLLGGGTPLFPRLDARRGVELIATRSFDNGVLALTYRFVRPEAKARM